MVRIYAVIASILALSGCAHVTRGGGFGPFYTSDGIEIRGTGEGCSVFASFGYDGKGHRAVKFYKLTIVDHGVERRDVEFKFSSPQLGEKQADTAASKANVYTDEFLHACSVLGRASPEKREVHARYFEEAVVLAVEYLTRFEKATNNAEFDAENLRYDARSKELSCRRPESPPPFGPEPWCKK